MVTVVVAEAVQVFGPVTVTVYVVGVVGLTMIIAVVGPVFQRYVPVPLLDAVRVADCPAQIFVLPLIEAVGIVFGFAVTELLATLVHPPTV